MKLHYRHSVIIVLAALTAAALTSAPIRAASHMSMSKSMSDTPAHFKPKLSVYTTNHDFLIKITSLPHPIPYQKYFSMKFSVYDSHQPNKLLPKAKLKMFAGMRHGLKHGFAHGMQSAPKIGDKNGVFPINGMYFHMMGKWTLKVTVSDHGQKGIAYFDLPCCGT